MLRDMSALWGKRMMGVAAVVPVAGLLAAALSGCEYADDGGPPGLAGSPPRSNAGPDRPDSGKASTSPTVQPERANDEQLRRLLGPPGTDQLPYVTATGAAAAWSTEVPAGDYLLTAACVAAQYGVLEVRLAGAAPEQSNLLCHTRRVMRLNHQGGLITARVASAAEPRFGASGFRLEPYPDAPGSTVEPAAGWSAEQFGPAQPGEVRGYPVAGRWHRSGQVGSPGTLTLTFACEGTGTVEISVVKPNGEDLLSGSGFPCGRPRPTDIPVGPDGILVRVDSTSDTVRAAYSLLPAAGSGL